MQKYLYLLVFLSCFNQNNIVFGMEGQQEENNEVLWDGIPGENKPEYKFEFPKHAQMCFALQQQQSYSNQPQLLGSAHFAIKKEENLDQKFVQKIIAESPSPIQRVVQIINKRKDQNNLFQAEPYRTNIYVLVGDPGVGKSTLAKAIPLYCGLHYTLISMQSLANEFQHSGQSNLMAALGPLVDQEGPLTIILDELDKIIKKRNKDDYNIEAAETLWEYLDIFRKKKNILVIGTANELEILPEPLMSRLEDGIQEIVLPDQKKREKIISYYLNLYAPSVNVIPSEKEIEILAENTEYFTPRNLEKMVTKGLSQASDRCKDNSKEKEESAVVPVVKDFEQAIVFLKSKNKRFDPFYKKAYKKIQPQLGPITYTFLPLGLQLGLNYWMHRQGMKQSLFFHLSTMAQQVQFHTEGMNLQREGLNQQKGFHEDQMYYTRIQTWANPFNIGGLILSRTWDFGCWTYQKIKSITFEN